VEDPTTIAMNLTFFGTLGIGLVMFFGVFLALVIVLLLAGLGRLLAIAGMALGRSLKSPRGSATQTAAVERAAEETGTAKASRPAKPAKPARKEPQLSPEWAAAVERADARAKARAKAEAAPEVTVSVRELPSPKAPVRDLKEVGPLVESATDRNGAAPGTPRASTKPAVPAASPVLDTGSLAMLKHEPAQQGQRQNTQRRAS